MNYSGKALIRAATALVLVVAISGCGPNQSASLSTDIRRDVTVNVIEEVMPCVVNIATTTLVERNDDPMQEALRRFFNWPTQRVPGYSIGSGVIVDEEGYILTNLHVLENATRVQVKLWNGEIYDAKPWVGIRQKDVALLEILAPPGKKFKAMKLAKDDDLLLGESVIAVGNPFGLGGTVTKGILSSKNRRMSSGRGELDFQDWLQTDADINPGNSGGPLINLRGELIGINVSMDSRGQGIGFAIPVKQVSEALSEFYTAEAARGLWFGARVGSFNAPLFVTFVQPNSPAAKSGLRVGQRVLKVNGREPKTLIEFQRFLTSRNDRTAKIEIEENGRRRTLDSMLVPFDELTIQKLGVRLRNLTSETASSVQVPPGDGVIIEEVQPDSPAAKAKLQPGFVIVAIDNQKISSLLNAADVISGKTTGQRAVVSFVVPPSFGESSGRYTANITMR